MKSFQNVLQKLSYRYRLVENLLLVLLAFLGLHVGLGPDVAADSPASDDLIQGRSAVVCSQAWPWLELGHGEYTVLSWC